MSPSPAANPQVKSMIGVSDPLQRLLHKPPLDAHTHTMLWVTVLPSHNM